MVDFYFNVNAVQVPYVKRYSHMYVKGKSHMYVSLTPVGVMSCEHIIKGKSDGPLIHTKPCIGVASLFLQFTDHILSGQYCDGD